MLAPSAVGHETAAVRDSIASRHRDRSQSAWPASQGVSHLRQNHLARMLIQDSDSAELRRGMPLAELGPNLAES